MEMFCKHKDIWRGRLGTVKAPNHAINLNNGTRSIRQYPYRAEQRYYVEPCEPIDKHMNAGVFETAQLLWASPIVLVSKKWHSSILCGELEPQH